MHSRFYFLSVFSALRVFEFFCFLLLFSCSTVLRYLLVPIFTSFLIWLSVMSEWDAAFSVGAGVGMDVHAFD